STARCSSRQPQTEVFSLLGTVCSARVAVSCVLHYSNCEFVRIPYTAIYLAAESAIVIPQAPAYSVAVSPSAEFISQRPNGGAPSGKPPPQPEPSVYWWATLPGYGGLLPKAATTNRTPGGLRGQTLFRSPASPYPLTVAVSTFCCQLGRQTK